jgi:hypothetical protein
MYCQVRSVPSPQDEGWENSLYIADERASSSSSQASDTSPSPSSPAPGLEGHRRSSIQDLHRVSHKRALSSDGLLTVEPLQRIARQHLAQFIDESLVPIGPHLCETKRTFLHYARIIAHRTLDVYPELTSSIERKIAAFVNEAADIEIDDHLPTHQQWAEIAQWPRIHINPRIVAFQNGTWSPPICEIQLLRETVLAMRQEIAAIHHIGIQCHVVTEEAYARVRCAIRANIIWNEFIDRKTEPEIQLMEHEVMANAKRMLFTAMFERRMVRKNILVPTRSPTPGEVEQKRTLAVLRAEWASRKIWWLTIASPIARGSYKIIWKALQIEGTGLPQEAPGPIWVYATFPELQRYTHKVKACLLQFDESQRPLPMAERARLTEKIEHYHKIIQEIQDDIAYEADVAQKLGSMAVWTRVATKRLNPYAIKGLVMQCAFSSLVRIANSQPFPQKIQMSYWMCRIVAYMHSLGLVHLDLKPDNFLGVMSPKGMTIKLADFGSTARLGEKLLCQVSSYPPPEMAPPYKPPFLAHTSMDMWDLGLSVVYVLYGNDTLRRFADDKGFPRAVDQISQQIDAFATNCQEINGILKGMLQRLPESRWLADRTAKALRPVMERWLPNPTSTSR